jgi:hypothetical protein
MKPAKNLSPLGVKISTAILIAVFVVFIPPIAIGYLFKDVLTFDPATFINDWLNIGITCIVIALFLKIFTIIKTKKELRYSVKEYLNTKYVTNMDKLAELLNLYPPSVDHSTFYISEITRLWQGLINRGPLPQDANILSPNFLDYLNRSISGVFSKNNDEKIKEILFSVQYKIYDKQNIAHNLREQIILNRSSIQSIIENIEV